MDGFEAVLAAVPSDRWLSPSPCEGWAAVDVAGHVTAGLLVIEMRAAGRPLPQDDPDWREVAGADPVASWRTVRARTMAELSPEALDRTIPLAFGDVVTLREWLEGYSPELLVHTWDLARATGQQVELDADLVRSALETSERLAPRGRAVGKVGPEVGVADGAGDQARLLALFGRDPAA
ncbi:TIGR03086 family metal-binding protein [Actinomadura sp. BRA 177]|uniref:TIGR03086 family metal-binding protein n=1 Tax=Actinomadura sp. BRA 177 TaxID=2745202 RepID=UPI001595FFEE|nr:TIGR03086 family metal-binding protein [Actinomadura sp. BRA 177]NVI88406.1 TIGR03086 family protein [Actinomadura sp. BRA 177]